MPFLKRETRRKIKRIFFGGVIENRTTVQLMNWLRPSDTHQVGSYTEPDRYPELFTISAEYFQNKPGKPAKMLSFGCSTGEECTSLRQYFPQAEVQGADINTENLSIARSKNYDSNVSFYYSTADSIKQNGPYDMISAMRVLCRMPLSDQIDDLSSDYPFEKFNNAICMLDEALAVGGLMLIYGSNYLFKDTTVASRYEALKDSRITESGTVPKFSRESKKLDGYNYDEVIFVKTR